MGPQRCSRKEVERTPGIQLELPVSSETELQDEVRIGQRSERL